MDTSWIIVIVLGVLLVIAVILGSVVWFKYLKRQDKTDITKGEDLSLSFDHGKKPTESEPMYDHARWEALMKSIEMEKSI